MIKHGWAKAPALAALVGCAGEPQPAAPTGLTEAAVIAASVPIAQSTEPNSAAQLQSGHCGRRGERRLGLPAGRPRHCRGPIGGKQGRGQPHRRKAPQPGRARPMTSPKPTPRSPPRRWWRESPIARSSRPAAGRAQRRMSSPPSRDAGTALVRCATCTAIAPDLKAHIDSLYPGDLATGFQLGRIARGLR